MDGPKFAQLIGQEPTSSYLTVTSIAGAGLCVALVQADWRSRSDGTRGAHWADRLLSRHGVYGASEAAV
jgi:hypothetical protein